MRVANVILEKSLLCPTNGDAAIRTTTKYMEEGATSQSSENLENMDTVWFVYGLAHCLCLLLLFKSQVPF